MANADILITGASGFVGGKLLDELRASGRVRVIVRDGSKVDADGIEVVEGDLTDRDDLARALEGIGMAYYLVHSMEPGDDDFVERDREMAQAFVDVAGQAGVERLVYLGGVQPPGEVSDHLRSRAEVEEVLGGGEPSLVALRASMVVGAQSDSFRTLAQIVGGLPALALPKWRDNRTQPIGIEDVVAALVAAEKVEPGSYNVAGPDEVTMEQMCEVIGQELGGERPSIPLAASTPKLEAAAAAVVADSDRAVLEPLMESMRDDLRMPDNRLKDVFGVEPTPFREAARRALSEMDERSAA